MTQTSKPFSILVIEPETLILSHLKKEFSEASLFPAQLDIAQSISEALQKLRGNSYHAVLSDIFFSNGESVEDVLKELDRKKSKTPVILIAQEGQEAKAHQLLKLGATDYFIRSDGAWEKLPSRFWSIYRNYELTENREGLTEEIQSENQKLLEVNEKLRSLSIRDELTNVYNHRYLQERLAEEFSRAVRYHHPLSCLMIDLDLFRKVNDHLGHVVGDQILKEAAERLLQGTRLSDLTARFGGEEFIILLPHTNYEGAREVAERLLYQFSDNVFLAESHKISTTISIGISCFPDDAMKDRNDLINFAEQALFYAKAAGRNRVSLYRQILPTPGETIPYLKIKEDRILEFQKKLSELADRARRGYLESSKALIMALEAKDPVTAGHSIRTARLCLQVAEAMGLSVDESETVEHAALLHDIGKICISDEILLKPGKLDMWEYETMKQHPYFGYRIVEPIRFLQKEATLILHHHEWFNGEGYPCRLSRHEIPLGARIISVVDAYDTMRVAGGRYKKTLSREEAVNELIACAGTQFDPEVVQAFIRVLVACKELAPDAYDKRRLQEAFGAGKGEI